MFEDYRWIRNPSDTSTLEPGEEKRCLQDIVRIWIACIWLRNEKFRLFTLYVYHCKPNTVFIWLTALGTCLILGPWGWALTWGGRLFEGGRLLFSQQFQQARTFLENNKTRDNEFISLQQNKKYKSKHEQAIDNTKVHWLPYLNQFWNTTDAPLTSHWASTEMTEMFFFFREGVGWVLINFLGFQVGRLFEVGG